MSKRLIKENNYPFYWLDDLAENIINPEKEQLRNLNTTDLQQIKKRLPDEFAEITATLKNQAFSLYCGEQLKIVAGHYDQAIGLLLKQAKFNLIQYPQAGLLHDTGRQLVDGLEELANNVTQRYRDYLPAIKPANLNQEALFKVLCRLSVDQVAIILKAADDTKLLVARSFSLVLKKIVPFLSTERLQNFSWKSARASTYKMEGNDKEIAIQTLESLIRQIRGY